MPLTSRGDNSSRPRLGVLLRATCARTSPWKPLRTMSTKKLAVVKRERDDARKELRLVREMVARLITSIASALRAE